MSLDPGHRVVGDIPPACCADEVPTQVAQIVVEASPRRRRLGVGGRSVVDGAVAVADPFDRGLHQAEQGCGQRGGKRGFEAGRKAHHGHDRIDELPPRGDLGVGPGLNGQHTLTGRLDDEPGHLAELDDLSVLVLRVAGGQGLGEPHPLRGDESVEEVGQRRRRGWTARRRAGVQSVLAELAEDGGQP
jgi:hypothetical protein